MRPMLQGVRRSFEPSRPYANPLGDEEFPLLAMPQNFRSQVLLAQTPRDVQLPTETLTQITYPQDSRSFFFSAKKL